MAGYNPIEYEVKDAEIYWHNTNKMWVFYISWEAISDGLFESCGTFHELPGVIPDTPDTPDYTVNYNYEPESE